MAHIKCLKGAVCNGKQPTAVKYGRRRTSGHNCQLWPLKLCVRCCDATVYDQSSNQRYETRCKLGRKMEKKFFLL